MAGRHGRPRVGDRRLRQGDRDRARRLLPGLDLQRPGAGTDPARQRGRPAAHPLHQRRHPPPHHALPRHPQRLPGRRHRDRPRRDRRSARSSPTSSRPSPFGCHLYHCHATPLKRHIHKGLYGAFIVNPDPAKHGDAAKARHPDYAESEEWQEFVMVMNAFDTTFDAEQRGLRGQHGRLPLHEAPDRDRPHAAGPHLPGQRHRVRPDQLLPPARQLLRLLRHRHAGWSRRCARSTRSCRRRRSAASWSSPTRTTSRGCTCSTPTSPNSPSSAGWGSSMSVSTASRSRMTDADRGPPHRRRATGAGFSPRSARSGRSCRCCCWPAVLALIVRTDAGLGDRTAPPIETLSVQRVLAARAGT